MKTIGAAGAMIVDCPSGSEQVSNHAEVPESAGDDQRRSKQRRRASSPTLQLSQELRAEVIPGSSIALAWVYDEAERLYWHNGAISG